MSGQNNKKNSYVYLPLLLTFAFLLCCFVVELISIRGQSSALSYSISKVSPFDISNESNSYEFVETDNKNGIKYYVLKNRGDNTSSQSDVSSQPITADPNGITVELPKQNGKVAYLTFDDGPSENTFKILDILDEYKVKATFFVIYHKGFEKQYKEIVKRGHTIALHSYTHNYKTVYASESAYFNDLKKIDDYVYSVTGVRSKITRFPGGSSNTISNKYCKGLMKTLKKSVPEHGYIYHDWNVDSTDASGNNRPVETLLNNVKSNLTKCPNADVLMHDTGKAKNTTVEALPQIIEYIQSQGYSIERLTEDSTPVRHNW